MDIRLAEKMAVIITTDIGFRKWESVFYGDKLTSAIIERLGHHCHLISSRIELQI
ncbi:ATP-binding protein [Mesotoga prima]|uniref:ATP-binding protein n=1 Tax=Mesotoga prima TaxID=1184387 RepID=UPI002AA2A481|nr:ATP-binding protein [Mesotoga prima]